MLCGPIHVVVGAGLFVPGYGVARCFRVEGLGRGGAHEASAEGGPSCSLNRRRPLPSSCWAYFSPARGSTGDVLAVYVRHKTL